VGDSDRIGQANEGRRASAGLIITGIIVVAVAIFVAQNTETVPFEFLVFNFEWPLWLVLVVVFVLGAVVGQGAMWLRRRRRRKD
jgi:putative membrane protein